MPSKKRSTKANEQALRAGSGSCQVPVYRAEMSIASDTAEVHRLQEQLVEALQLHKYVEHDIFAIKLAMEEALVNAMRHGNRSDRTKRIHVKLRIDERRFYARICDEGCGFDPEGVDDPTTDENLMRSSGRGILLMKHYMNQVRFLDEGQTVVMWKRRNGRVASKDKNAKK